MLPLADNENIVVDPKKYQSIAIFLRALKVTCEDVSKAILDENSNSNELMNIDGEVRKLTNAHAGDFAQFLEPGVENPDRRPLPQCIYGLIFNEETQTSKRIMAIDGEQDQVWNQRWPVAVSTNASLQLVGEKRSL